LTKWQQVMKQKVDEMAIVDETAACQKWGK
jgi:hypothetical protein